MIKPAKISCSADGSTKYLWELEDGKFVESIYFELDDKGIYCLSSQVGCNVGCPFCETGKQKVLRNLSSEEIVQQVYGLFEDKGLSRIDEIDYAGMGEPLHNFEGVEESSDRMITENLTDLVSLTTSGIVPKMKLLPDTAVGELYLSMHASDNATRSLLVPVNRKWPIAETVDAASYVAEKLGRTVTANYLLFDNLNDADGDAVNLANALNPNDFRVQLSEWNLVSNFRYVPAKPERFEIFEDMLTERGYEVYKMVSSGTDVGGGCGQLSAQTLEDLAVAGDVE
ncbi:radical SAM protein [Yoonia maritima]|uniref:radical SAM protein n=1 Tax=Yoonia maritima TaxID=1435347 RepID=UPI000D0E7AE2|nr:radical SAM protein [Yoonia maritima]